MLERPQQERPEPSQRANVSSLLQARSSGGKPPRRGSSRVFPGYLRAPSSDTGAMPQKIYPQILRKSQE